MLLVLVNVNESMKEYNKLKQKIIGSSPSNLGITQVPTNFYDLPSNFNLFLIGGKHLTCANITFI
jgi:hypothetical protein